MCIRDSSYGSITYYVAFIVDNETMTFDYYLVKAVHSAFGIQTNDETDTGNKAALTIYYDIPESVNDTISGTGKVIRLEVSINGQSVTVDKAVERFISASEDGKYSYYEYDVTISEGEYAGSYTFAITLSTSTGRKITSVKYAA